MKRAGKKIRLLLADDHAALRGVLSSFLNGYNDIEVLAEAADGKEAVQIAQRLEPDVILMDIRMPKMNGIEATKIISSELPNVHIIGLSMYDDAEAAKGMLNAGAAAFLTKDGPLDALLAAIRDHGI